MVGQLREGEISSRASRCSLHCACPSPHPPARPWQEGEEPPEHSLLALGALTVLSRCSSCEPAKRAAVEALVSLQRARSDVLLPPPEAVAQVVASMRADAARREAEAAALMEEEAGEGEREEDEGGQEMVQEIEVEDEEGTIL